MKLLPIKISKSFYKAYSYWYFRNYYVGGSAKGIVIAIGKIRITIGGC